MSLISVSKYSIVNSVIHPISKSPANVRDIGHKSRVENSDVVNNDYANNGKYTTPLSSSRTTSTHCIHHALRCILVALIVSAYNAHINRIRTLRSEQIKTSRDLWERINEKYDLIIEIGISKGWPKDHSGVIDVPWAMVRSLVGEAICVFGE